MYNENVQRGVGIILSHVCCPLPPPPDHRSASSWDLEEGPNKGRKASGDTQCQPSKVGVPGVDWAPGTEESDENHMAVRRDKVAICSRLTDRR